MEDSMQEFVALSGACSWSVAEKQKNQALFERFCLYMSKITEDLDAKLWEEYAHYDFERVPMQLVRVIAFRCRQTISSSIEPNPGHPNALHSGTS